MVILYCLMEFRVVRFNELKRYLKTVSDKTLSRNLKELERDQLILRQEYPQIPPRVEYRLSERGPVPDEDPRPAVRLGRRKTVFSIRLTAGRGSNGRYNAKGPHLSVQECGRWGPVFLF